MPYVFIILAALFLTFGGAQAQTADAASGADRYLGGGGSGISGGGAKGVIDGRLAGIP